MNGSIRIGSVLGITLRLHVVLLVLFAVLVVAGADPLVFVLLFGCVLLHELGHSLVALAFGIRVVDITLWPLGGMARMSFIPESARIEGLIAIAGPAVNFALALPAFLAAGAWPSALQSPLEWFGLMNLWMGLFNLLPAFPMDGGRLLRAFLGRGGDWLGATERAARLGRWLAALLVLAGLTGVPGLLEPSLALPVVGLFVWWSGSQELLVVRARHASRAAADANARGFDPGAIEELERYRGPLSSWKQDEP